MITRERDKDRWKLLGKHYRERGLALVLGAGVSTGCKLPGWRELLCRVATVCWGVSGRKTVGELIDGGMDLPAIAAVLEVERPKGTEFSDMLRQALYRDFPFSESLNTPAKRAQLVEFVRGKDNPSGGNSTMRAVAAFCALKEAEGFVANPNVHAVVTSNVDAVLRTYVRARYDAWLLRTIGSAKHNRRAGRIPTYYMHGFLHFYSDAKKEEAERVPSVFTEGEYFDFFNRPHSVFNYTFLYLLREFHCVFIGMSMQDPNIRRLLHYSVSERRGSVGVDTKRTALRHYAILTRSASRTIDELTDLSLRLLGTRALWIESHNAIPEHLGDLYGEAAWEGVYV